MNLRDFGRAIDGARFFSVTANPHGKEVIGILFPQVATWWLVTFLPHLSLVFPLIFYWLQNTLLLCYKLYHPLRTVSIEYLILIRAILIPLRFFQFSINFPLILRRKRTIIRDINICSGNCIQECCTLNS